MKIDLQIPDETARQLAAAGKDPARAALEALALQAYREEVLGEASIRRMLGFATRMQVHAFLKDHGVYLHYDVSDLEHDRESADRLRAKLRVPK